MTHPHTQHTPAPSAADHTLISQALDQPSLVFDAPRLSLFSSAMRAVSRYIQNSLAQRRTALRQPVQARLPDSLYSALHQFNSPQRPN